MFWLDIRLTWPNNFWLYIWPFFIFTVYLETVHEFKKEIGIQSVLGMFFPKLKYIFHYQFSFFQYSSLNMKKTIFIAITSIYLIKTLLNLPASLIWWYNDLYYRMNSQYESLHYHFKAMSYLSDPYLTDTFFSPFPFLH